jgi:putative PIN family toxin of toxin-antitoxin system
MSHSRRVVLDTSTLVSAALYTGSIPDQALSKALEFFDLCASVETLVELELVLDRGKFDRYRGREPRSAFVATIRRRSNLFAVGVADLSAVDPPCRDPKDDQFLALALVAEADAIVSSDHDLLALNPWRGIRILSPAEFLAEGPDYRP